MISSKDNDEERIMHSKSDNTEIMIIDKANETIGKRLESLLNRYHIELETSVSDTDLIFDCVH